jgi:A/G-specific adenine glycosylase
MGYSLARRVIDWYRRARRDLPWRRTRDPYRIWVSEVMLQQTRVAAVIPYYERFLARFPDAASLAAASEDDLLAAWSGLGYYSRARNLQKAARLIRHAGAFPRDYDSIRALPGVGGYTAAAVASIAFNLPHAVIDGNVLRVLARFSADGGDIQSPATRARLAAQAQALLDRRHPGDFNQAMMELGATVCLPRTPRCEACPLARDCRARIDGQPERYPVRRPRPAPVRVERVLLLVRHRGRLLMRKVAGFWELPEARELVGASVRAQVGRFRHSIMNRQYHVELREASLRRKPAALEWIGAPDLPRLPLSTAARKALRLAGFDL